MKKTIVLISLLLSACSGVDTKYVSEGKQVYEAYCPGTARSMGDCFALATKKCNGAFDVVDKSEVEHEGFINRHLLFSCK